MNIISPARPSRLNEAVGFLLFLAGLGIALCLASYNPLDPSGNTATQVAHTQNLLGRAGAAAADLLLQVFGLAAYLLPLLIWLLGWKWVQSQTIHGVGVRIAGALALWLSVSTAFGLAPHWHPIGGVVPASGMVGRLLADYLVAQVNPVGAMILTSAAAIIALYLLTTFQLSMLSRFLAGPLSWLRSIGARLRAWNDVRRDRAKLRAQERVAARSERRRQIQARTGSEEFDPAESARPRRRGTNSLIPDDGFPGGQKSARDGAIGDSDLPPWPLPPQVEQELEEKEFHRKREFERSKAWLGGPATSDEDVDEDIPIRPLAAATSVSAGPVIVPRAGLDEDDDGVPPFDTPVTPEKPFRRKRIYHLPSSDLLNEIPARNGYDSTELKEVASKIKSKLEEFNVRGSVVQINPGPVVTTFEYKPEAGIKYSRITTLSEDLCLGLQAESVLIERLPGKPTIGIEVPNTRREVISLREILESGEFLEASSKMTMALGKDINGRIKVSPLETMPHLLIAGSTGSGKSVMLNAMIMSFLYKATPDEVKMIMVDPKRVELGIYEGIPHLLTPVITEPKKATNALRNAVLEMERRLKLLASQGVRNIDQFNKKVAQLRQKPMNLFNEEVEDEDLKPLPYILILIDELADLMMLERANVEECITRLAQMARAVGMHLVLATQRPSVDVITGLIKANFPSRISFRVATRVDSRTVLDSMGAEHLLGRGDMLFLPPGSSRLTRVHGAFVTEAETNRVVDFWKAQASPEYDQSFLLTPPSEDLEEEDADGEAYEGGNDPMYQDAVRIVVEMGKASTSTLQRRLRLGYGRAARILDMMQRDGIIGPPDGSRPREVLKRPDWLQEVEGSLR
jgi:DNA segregation ATPase FtsK/SpoIIIE, S-DNA-T family